MGVYHTATKRTGSGPHTANWTTLPYRHISRLLRRNIQYEDEEEMEDEEWRRAAADKGQRMKDLAGRTLGDRFKVSTLIYESPK